MTIGDDCLLGGFVKPGSEFPRTDTGVLGRDRPAETGRSGIVVLKLGGVSSGKSGGTIGRGRGPGPGELPRDTGAELRPLVIALPVEIERPLTNCGVCPGVLRVGVDGRDRKAVEVELVGV